ncbi:MAG: HEAT repeat domain-containing protein [Gemmatimonadota bacterium]
MTSAGPGLPGGMRPRWSRRGQASVLALVLTVLTVLQGCQADPGYGGRTSAEWAAQLRDAPAREREQAARALGTVLSLNPRLSAPTTALIAALSDTVDAVRVAAAQALAQPGVRVKAATAAALGAMLADSAHAAVRMQAVRALGMLATNAVDSLARREMERAILRLHRDPDASVRAAVAATLTEARTKTSAPGTRQEIDAVLEMLARDTMQAPRAAALVGLALAMTPRAVPAVRQAARDASPVIRALAAGALGRVTNDAAMSDAAMASLLELVTDSATAVRLAAVQALGTRTASHPPAVDAALRVASRDTNALVQREARHALSRFHARGGKDPVGPEPTHAERCAQLPPRTRGC